MRIRVHLFARLRDIAQQVMVEVELPAPCTVGQLRAELTRSYPLLEPMLPHCAIGINGELADATAEIPEDAEVAILPPVSGGSRA